MYLRTSSSSVATKKRDKGKKDKLAHEVVVHSDEVDGQSVGEELFLDLDGLRDDLGDGIGVRSSLEVREQETGEIGVKTLITGDELVGEGQSRHETSLLEPEDGSERTCCCLCDQFSI